MSLSALRCPCGGAYASVVAEEKGHRQLRCGSCGLVGSDPRDFELSEQYDTKFFEKNYLDRADHWTRSHRHWIDTVARPLLEGKTRPRVLDVGCGVGLSLAALPASWDRVGIEPAAAAAALARERLGLDVRTAFLEDLDDPEGFDLIAFWDVVEHVPDPIAFLGAARRLLRPGGRIVMKVPHMGRRALSVGRALTRVGKAHVLFHTGIHLYQFDARTLRATVERAGYAVEKLDVRGPASRLGEILASKRLTARLAHALFVATGSSNVMIAVARPVA